MPAGKPVGARAYLSECVVKLQDRLEKGSHVAWSARKDRGAKRGFLRKSIYGRQTKRGRRSATSLSEKNGAGRKRKKMAGALFF